MHARWLVVGTLVASIAQADPKPTPVDTKAFKDALVVLQDAQGGTYVVLRNDSERRVWYGTGTKLYEQAVVGASRNGDAWSIATWAPRITGIRPGSIDRKQDGTFVRSCGGEDDVGLSPVTGDKAKAILGKATLYSEYLVRRPYLLARDDSAVYYYVDHLSAKYGGKGYRLFVGKKGAMKDIPLVDIATDTAGDVFATKHGELRFVHTVDEGGKSTLTWVRGEKRSTLINLDTDASSPLIFKDLGVYAFTGTLCENI